MKIVVLLVIIAVVIALLLVIHRQRNQARKRALRAIKARRQVHLLRVKEIIDSPLSDLVDNPSPYRWGAAIGGCVLLFLYYYLVIGFPWYVSFVGLLFGVVPGYLARLWIQVLEVRTITASLDFFNSIAAMMSAPQVSLERIKTEVNRAEVEPWLVFLFNQAISRKEVRVPALPRLTNLWSAVARIFLAPESLAAAGKALATMLATEIQGVEIEESVGSIMEVLLSLVGFLAPAAVGIAMVIAVMGMVRGLPAARLFGQ